MQKTLRWVAAQAILRFRWNQALTVTALVAFSTSVPVLHGQSAPSTGDQHKALANIKEYALDYAGSLPDNKVLMGPMLRVILEDRFQLKLRRETEEVPMYGLIVSNGGLKIQPVGPDGCRQRKPEANLTYEQQLAQIRAGEKPFCGVSGGSEGPNIHMGLWRFDARQLCGNSLGQP